MNGTLPTWIQRMFGVEAGPGEGAAWHLEYTWPLAPWATLLIVVLLTALVAVVYSRDGRRLGRRWKIALASIRAAAIGMVLLMISQIVLCVERTGLPYLAVVLDDSASMTIADRRDDRVAKRLDRRIASAGLSPTEPNRENLAKMLLLEDHSRWLGQFSRDYKLRFYSLTGPREIRFESLDQLAEQIRAVRAEGETTRLGAAVETVLGDLRGTAPAGIVLLTDGINTEGPGLDQAAAEARRRGVPLFIVGIGDQRAAADARLTDLLVDDVVFADDVVFFEATLAAPGYGGQRLRLTLREEGRPDVLAAAETTAEPDGRAQTVRLAYRPSKAGRFRYVVEVEPAAGELQTDNNRLTRNVEVRKERIRVLLVQAYPNYEYRYLRKMLGRDETIRLDALLQEADLEHAQQDAAAMAVFPVRREELAQYDVIILGDVDFARLGPGSLENLAAVVDRPGGGTALVFLAGPRFNPAALGGTPLERLLPVALGSVRVPSPDEPLVDGFTVEPTELGLESPAMQLGDAPARTKTIWENLPPLYWMIDAPELKPGAQVLAVNPRRSGPAGRPLPVIVTQYVGAGKVLMHMTDETWRWRLGHGDRYFARYWIQMIRYLARSKLADGEGTAVLTTDRREYRQGEPVRLRLRFAEPGAAAAGAEDVVLVVEREGGRTRRLSMTRHPVREMFEITFDAAAGRYHAWVASPLAGGAPPTVDFTVARPAGEFERVQMEEASLRRAADQTRGRFYTIAKADRLARDLPAGRQVPIESLPPVPLWNRWPVLATFVGLLITEWVVRKRKGLA